MLHHFADFLHRDEGHWTIVPNRERFAYRISDVSEGASDISVMTISKGDTDWQRVLTLPNLTELTLHEPSIEQLTSISSIQSIRRLRITHLRIPSLDCISRMSALEELVLEYVSGFSDLSPIGMLKNLRALHMENLRKVTEFGGLQAVTNLKYLAINGTLDWEQPIENFEFLHGLSQLEVLTLWQIKCRAPYPAMLPATSLKNLKRLRIHRSYLPTNEYALLEEALHEVQGASWGAYEKVVRSKMPLPGDDIRASLSDEELRAKHPEVQLDYYGHRLVDDPSSFWFEFTGRSAGRVKCSSPSAEAKCQEKSMQYEHMRVQARELI